MAPEFTKEEKEAIPRIQHMVRTQMAGAENTAWDLLVSSREQLEEAREFIWAIHHKAKFKRDLEEMAAEQEALKPIFAEAARAIREG